MGLQVDEARRLELPERLADRRPADAELGRERVLAEPGPRRDRPAEDALLQVGGELVDERSAVLLALGPGPDGTGIGSS
jgi:hypothetical protein